MFPGQSVPQLNLSHLARPQGSTIKPQSCSQATGFQNQTFLMFPGHRLPEANLSLFPRTQVSRINPISCPLSTVFQNQTSVICQATGFHHQTSDMFPGHSVPESIRSLAPEPQGSRIHSCHVPRPQGSRINPHLCSQATGFQNKTSFIFPVHRFRETRLSKAPRAQYSTI